LAFHTVGETVVVMGVSSEATRASNQTMQLTATVPRSERLSMIYSLPPQVDLAAGSRS
jgi:hypothetical protein